MSKGGEMGRKKEAPEKHRGVGNQKTNFGQKKGPKSTKTCQNREKKQVLPTKPKFIKKK